MNELITKHMILMDLDAEDKNDAIKKLAKIIESQGRLIDYNGFIEQVKEREENFPTSIGFNFAIPHGKCGSVRTAALAFARLKNEVQWSEDEKSKFIFLIAVSDKEAGDEHLRILAKLSRKIMSEEFREKLENAKCSDEILGILDI